MIKKAIILGVLFTSVVNVYAEQLPRSLKSDHRIKVASYREDNVFPIYGNYGYSTHVRLSPDEKIQKVDIGDSDAWVITASDNNLFVKNAIDSDTNMSVITDKRSYVFRLTTSTKPEQLTYQLKFTYPEDKKSELTLQKLRKKSLSENLKHINPQKINWKYGYAPFSNSDLAPLKAFDDGKFTYFKFSDKKSLPAIFAVDDSGDESLVNYTKDGEYIVLHRIDKRYHLRLGDKSIAVFNGKISEA